MIDRDVFAAIGHPTRRRILVRLATEGSSSLTTLAEGFDESRQAIRKHVRVLSEAELVELKAIGREQHCVLTAERLAEVHQWVSFFENHWDAKLASLKSFVEKDVDKGTRSASKRVQPKELDEGQARTRSAKKRATKKRPKR